MQNSRVFSCLFKLFICSGFGVPKIKLGRGKILAAGTAIPSAVLEQILSPDPKKQINLT